MSGLVPIEQKTVLFYDDEITAVVVQHNVERVVYVPLRPICDYLGLDWSGQRQRINRDPVLSGAVSGVVVTPTPLHDNQFANPQEMLCIPLDFLNGWLFGVSANRVKPEIREKLIAYQRECYRVLAKHFVSSPVSSSDSMLVQVEAMGLAIAALAREQMEYDRRLGGTETVVSRLDERLNVLEAKIAPPTRAVTDEQASQVSQAVKAVALTLSKRSGRNEYGGVYGEMYRRYQITGYKLLPAAKFQETMDWLTEWHQSLVEDAPF